MARDALEYMLSGLEDPELQDALIKLVNILKELNKSGLLDLLAAITNPMVVERLLNLLINTGTMKLVDNIDNLTAKLADIAMILESPGRKITISEFLNSLRDPDVSKGLYKLIEILRVLGRQ